MKIPHRIPNRIIFSLFSVQEFFRKITKEIFFLCNLKNPMTLSFSHCTKVAPSLWNSIAYYAVWSKRQVSYVSKWGIQMQFDCFNFVLGNWQIFAQLLFSLIILCHDWTDTNTFNRVWRRHAPLGTKSAPQSASARKAPIFDTYL